MGFIDDIWTALLSDDASEEGAALKRISADPVASKVARSVLTGSAKDSRRDSGDRKGRDP
ncbi:MAG: hypothetical protein F4Y99_10170 [Acidimicrobiaceae bacterium]|nr:hypothetical protein [Acidimicrobiaceae bacterium]MYF44334.1 hypothetical protein [Acidimicrobiaceae bacterium]MYJ34400.1 hypothetical protein [Acidimicrobiaceae bacterium]